MKEEIITDSELSKVQKNNDNELADRTESEGMNVPEPDYNPSGKGRGIWSSNLYYFR